MRLLVLAGLLAGLLAGFLAGCSSSQVTAREIPLTPHEKAQARSIQRFIEDEGDRVAAARDRALHEMCHARGIDERSFLQQRGDEWVWIAPVTSGT